MSGNIMNFGENKIADFFRQDVDLDAILPAQWSIVPCSAVSDSAYTPLVGLGVAPALVNRSLTAFKSTQDDNLVSTGTSKLTKNSAAISFGTPTGTGTLVGVVFEDDDGNPWFFAEVDEVDFTSGDPDPLEIAAGALQLKLGRLGGASHDLVNPMIDLLFRGEDYAAPTVMGVAQYTTAPTDAGGGVEASYTGYARAELIPSLTTLSGTQSAGSTTASSGTGGRISNNETVSHADPGGTPGTTLATIVAVGIFDALTTGTLLWWRAITPVTVRSGTPGKSYPPNTLGFTIA